MCRLRQFILIAVVALGLILTTGYHQISSAWAAENKKSDTVQLETTAQSAVMMDGNGTILYDKDSHKRLPPASVTKVMTLLLAVEAVEQERMKLTDEIYTSENAWRQGGSQIWLEPGEKMTAKEMMT
ncbi:MAG TPA: serine hydrolase, partial [Negativicutes bacterium]